MKNQISPSTVAATSNPAVPISRSYVPVGGGDGAAANAHPSRPAPVPRRSQRRASILRSVLLLWCATCGLWAGMAVARETRHIPISHTIRRAADRGQPHQPSAPPVLPGGALAALTYVGHQQPVRALTWSPDGTRLASGDEGGRVLIWNLQGRTLLSLSAPGPVRALAWSPDSRLLAIGAGTQLTFVRAATGETAGSFPQAHAGAVTALAWSHRGPSRLVSTGLDRRAIVWDGKELQPLLTFTGHTASIEAVTWAADGQSVASASLGGVVRVWHSSDGQEIHGYFLVPATPLRAAAFAPAGQLLAVGGDDGDVRLWNGLTCASATPGTTGFQCRDTPTTFRAQTGAVRALSWDPDGRLLLASGGDDGILALWTPPWRSDTPLLSLRLPQPVVSLAWSPDGHLLASAAGNVVTLWRLL
jgi:WD40 repeat protein